MSEHIFTAENMKSTKTLTKAVEDLLLECKIEIERLLSDDEKALWHKLDMKFFDAVFYFATQEKYNGKEVGICFELFEESIRYANFKLSSIFGGRKNITARTNGRISNILISFIDRIRNVDSNLFVESMYEDNYLNFLNKILLEHKARFYLFMIIIHHKQNGKWPSKESKSNHVKQLGQKFMAFKSSKAKRVLGEVVFYSSLQVVADKYGYPEMFETIDKEKVALDKLNEIIDFYEDNNKWPDRRDHANLHDKLCYFRKSFRDQGSSRFYSSLMELAKERGHPDMFNMIDKEQIAIDKLNEIIDFYEENNSWPSEKSKNIEEKSLGKRFSHFKQDKKKGSSRFYSSLMELAKERGHPDMFNMIDKEKLAIDKLNKIIDFHEDNNRWPSYASCDMIEKRLGSSLSQIRQSHNGKGTKKFYPIFLELAEKRGYPNMFKTKWKVNKK